MPDAFLLTRRSILAMPLALAACKEGWSVLELSGPTMGTGYSIVAMDHSRSVQAEDLKAAVEASLAQVNAQMSNWDAGSELSRFNAAAADESFAVSPELAHVMRAAEQVHLASEGRFDVTAGPLIDLWGFGARGPQKAMPDDTEIAEALERTGQSRVVRVGETTLAKTVPGTEVHVSAIGKGFGVDRVAAVMREFGLSDYMVEIGGDLYTAGNNPDGRPWQIGIETPEAHDRGVERVVGVSGMGMATSGDYRNYFERDGKRYSHIIDATTGRPVTHHTASVTVLTEDAMMADAWATALLVLGREHGMAIAEKHELAALFIDRDPEAASFSSTASSAFAALTA